MAMDINGLNSNQANTSKAKSGDKLTAPKNSGSASSPKVDTNSNKDTVSISAEAKKLSQLSGQLGADTPVNRDKIEALKSAISDGSYKVDSQQIAKKMLSDDTLF